MTKAKDHGMIRTAPQSAELAGGESDWYNPVDRQEQEAYPYGAVGK